MGSKRDRSGPLQEKSWSEKLCENTAKNLAICWNIRVSDTTRKRYNVSVRTTSREDLLGATLSKNPQRLHAKYLTMNRSKATLIGLLYTDGCLSPKGKSSWRFYFSNKSWRLITIFRECMVQVFDLPASRVRISTSNGFSRAVVNSKESGTLLTGEFGTFRTLRYATGDFPAAHLPVQQLLQNNVAEEFLRAAFSCDGGVSLYVARRKGARGGTKWLIRGVYLACFHPHLRMQYQELLKALGIESRNVAGDGKIKIETKRDIIRFSQRVGFLRGVHITHTSRFWPKIEKQKLLERLVQSYESPRDVYLLPQFEHREVMI